MKDYYKILGVKEAATEEEIRERWIGLMRQYHPDRIGEKASDDLRPEEINEAYEVLKFSSSRVKYDLERAYERRKRRKGLRRSLLRRSYLLLIPFLLGLIYLSIEGFVSPPWQNEGEVPKSKKKPVKASQQVSQEEENVRFKNRRPHLLAPFVGVGEANPQEDRGSLQKAAKERPGGGIRREITGEIESKGLREPPKKEAMKEAPGEARKEIPPQAERTRPLNSEDQPVALSGRESRSMASRQDPGGAPAQQSGGLNSRKPADGRVAMEEEVHRFFENYVSYYTQRDIAGFLGFFFHGSRPEQEGGSQWNQKDLWRIFRSEPESDLFLKESEDRNFPEPCPGEGFL